MMQVTFTNKKASKSLVFTKEFNYFHEIMYLGNNLSVEVYFRIFYLVFFFMLGRLSARHCHRHSEMYKGISICSLVSLYSNQMKTIYVK